MKKVVVSSLILVIIDQAIKALVKAFIPYAQLKTIIPNLFHLTNLKNSGAAWSLFSGQLLFLIALGIAAIVFIYFILKEEENPKQIIKISCILLFAGITGNLIDRIFTGGVIDYLFVDLFDFPVFNLSDIFIVIGAFLLSYDIIRGEIDERTNSR